MFILLYVNYTTVKLFKKIISEETSLKSLLPLWRSKLPWPWMPLHVFAGYAINAKPWVPFIQAIYQVCICSKQCWEMKLLPAHEEQTCLMSTTSLKFSCAMQTHSIYAYPHGPILCLSMRLGGMSNQQICRHSCCLLCCE